MDEVWNILFKKKKSMRQEFPLFYHCTFSTASIMLRFAYYHPSTSLISFTNLVGIHVVCHALITSIILSLSGYNYIFMCATFFFIVKYIFPASEVMIKLY